MKWEQAWAAVRRRCLHSFTFTEGEGGNSAQERDSATKPGGRSDKDCSRLEWLTIRLHACTARLFSVFAFLGRHGWLLGFQPMPLSEFGDHTQWNFLYIYFF
jgi:hypothetical protein